MILTRLRTDRRGGAGLAPVFVIMAVLVSAAIAAALVIGQVTSSRTTAELDMDHAARSAVAALAADASNRGGATVNTAINSGAGTYVPDSIAGILTTGATVTYTASTLTGTTMEVTFTVAAPRQNVKDITAKVTLTQETREWDGERWVPVAGHANPDRTVWVPTKVVKG